MWVVRVGGDDGQPLRVSRKNSSCAHPQGSASGSGALGARKSRRWIECGRRRRTRSGDCRRRRTPTLQRHPAPLPSDCQPARHPAWRGTPCQTTTVVRGMAVEYREPLAHRPAGALACRVHPLAAPLQQRVGASPERSNLLAPARPCVSCCHRRQLEFSGGKRGKACGRENMALSQTARSSNCRLAFTRAS